VSGAPGTFLLTFDVELIWGVFFDARWRRRALAHFGAVREVFPRLLGTLARHDVRATFAFVGHLFLGSCARVDGRTHPEMVRPVHRHFPGDWYAFDPGTDVARDPLFYAPDLVRLVREARPLHEIGAHGFSHAFLDTDRDLARAEMRAAAEAARAAGVAARSFVYPRNLVGFPEELAGAGFTHYREAGAGGSREMPPRRGPLARAARLAARLLGAGPPVGLPRRVGPVVEVPASVPILPASGARRLVPNAVRVAEVRRGLARARDRGAVFHLWTHPHNFVGGTEKSLAFLDRALGLVSAARERGEVRVATMSEVAP
jgi:peptidoglycan/xylan/chitin deacetylase (PgdA/CDA1 family)